MGVGLARGGGRAWYPSGPRLDGKRSSDEQYAPQEVKDVNPDPKKWEIIDAKEVGSNMLVVKIKYPNCINYEGIKILVYKDVTLLKLIQQKEIDPHFFESKKVASPVARFVPTSEGWEMALKFAGLYAKRLRQ